MNLKDKVIFIPEGDISKQATKSMPDLIAYVKLSDVNEYLQQKIKEARIVELKQLLEDIDKQFPYTRGRVENRIKELEKGE